MSQRANGLIPGALPNSSSRVGHVGAGQATAVVMPALKPVEKMLVAGQGMLSSAQPSTSLANRALCVYSIRGLNIYQQPARVSLMPRQAIAHQAGRPLSSAPPPNDQCKIDLCIRNVVAIFQTCCHLNLYTVAMKFCNVIYERSRGVLVMQVREPRCYVKMWSSGKVVVSGNVSEEAARRNCRGIARMLYKCLGPQVRFAGYRVTNIMATCKLPFGIRISQVAVDYPQQSSYEPEISVGLLWRSVNPKATLRVHTTGSVTITGAESQQNILTVMDSIFPILSSYKCAVSADAASQYRTNRQQELEESFFDDSLYDMCGFS